MLKKKELRALSEISNGADEVPALSQTLSLGIPQTYNIVRSLIKKEFVSNEKGILLVEKKTHIAILLEILNDSPDSFKVLSDSGMEIIRSLTEPRSVSEITSLTGLHQTTITRKIDLMRRMGMVKKRGSIYSINEELWPKLGVLARSYDSYTKLIDPRVPIGSEIYHSSNDLAVFSSKRKLDQKRTAFSKFGDYGMTIYPGTNYYCSSDRIPDLKEIFLHSLYVVEKDKNWRNKMLALIFFVIHKQELNDVTHPVVEEMRAVLKGVQVKGWVPLDEMNERAKMYGVDLNDY